MNKVWRLGWAVCCLLALSGCQPAQQEAPAAPRPVWVMTVGAGSTADTPAYAGEVKSRYESLIGFRVAGKIISRSVNVGDSVRRGQRIAALDASDTQLSAQAARAEVESAQAQLALAQAELQRRQQLYQQQFISSSALDQYQTQVKTAQARLQQAQSQAAVSQRQTGYSRLLADRDGVIGMIQAEPGQVVAAGQTIAKIYDLNQLEVQIAVPESAISQYRVGQAAEIRLQPQGPSSASQILAGRVREIAPAANSMTRAFDVRVRYQPANTGPAPDIKLGMTAEVRVASAAPSRLIVPMTAVTQQAGQAMVWVIDAQQRAQARPVTTGNLSEDGMEILSGLQAGETIATIGVHTLTAGLLVRPVTPTPEGLR